MPISQIDTEVLYKMHRRSLRLTLPYKHGTISELILVMPISQIDTEVLNKMHHRVSLSDQHCRISMVQFLSLFLHCRSLRSASPCKCSAKNQKTWFSYPFRQLSRSIIASWVASNEIARGVNCLLISGSVSVFSMNADSLARLLMRSSSARVSQSSVKIGGDIFLRIFLLKHVHSRKSEVAE